MQGFYQRWPALALALLCAGPALAGVQVTYQTPERFSDLPFSPAERAAILQQMSEHFDALGKRLPAGQDLQVEVSDIDLAGRIVHSQRWNEEVRVLRGGADWPRMRFHYRLSEAGRELASGDAELANMDYQQRINRYSSSDPLRYEKQMLDDWFGKTLAPPRR